MSAYQYLRDLARKHRYLTCRADLSRPSDLEHVERILRDRGCVFDMLDISNVWWEHYCGDGVHLARSIDQLRESGVVGPGALLISSFVDPARRSQKFTTYYYASFSLKDTDGTHILRALYSLDPAAQPLGLNWRKRNALPDRNPLQHYIQKCSPPRGYAP
ncbi:MAG: hypothetical protein AAF355_02400 [Myxococcota bacterium]